MLQKLKNWTNLILYTLKNILNKIVNEFTLTPFKYLWAGLYYVEIILRVIILREKAVRDYFVALVGWLRLLSGEEITEIILLFRDDWGYIVKGGVWDYNVVESVSDYIAVESWVRLYCGSEVYYIILKRRAADTSLFWRVEQDYVVNEGINEIIIWWRIDWDYVEVEGCLRL